MRDLTITMKASLMGGFHRDSDGARTHDPQLRRLLL